MQVLFFEYFKPIVVEYIYNIQGFEYLHSS